MPSREPELYKDKVEVSLDGRQIFYLFFGGAMIVGIVFVLGVLVGRRVEARGHIDRARTHSATDPLAALDRLEGSGGLSFRGALTGKDQPTDVEKTIGALEKARTDKPAAAKVEKTAEKAEKSEKSDKVEKKAEPATGPVVKPEKAVEPKAQAKAETRTDAKSDSKLEAKADVKSEPKKVDESKESKEAREAKEAKQRFTLQLSSFQDKAEAEAFLSSVKAQGYQAQITQAEVEGKGTFYRVRMGTYRSLDAASTAKKDFESASNKSASIMKL
ncbi:MAG: Sporulation domain protein [Myxococcales bacterium]|nr:Sporulation domain protein [Myxococcales bacterium]